MSEKLSQRLQEKFRAIEEKTGAPTTGALLGAGIGGAMKLAGKGQGILKGAAKGVYAGVVVELLLLGGAGIAQLVKKAREKGAAETKQSIKKAVARAQESQKYTNTQKAAIRNNGQVALAKIDQVAKVKPKHESCDCDHEECDHKKEKIKESEVTTEMGKDDPEDNADKVTVGESLGRSILERLDRLSEEGSAKKAAAAGAIGGAVVGHQVRKHTARNAVKKAVTQRNIARRGVKAAAAGTKAAVDNAGAAKTMLNKETRLAGQLAKKSPSGLVDKLKNHGAKLAQKGRVQAAANTLKGHPDVAKGLARQAKANANYGKANTALKGAKQALRKVGKLGGSGKGALIGAALGAGAYGLHKLANKNK